MWKLSFNKYLFINQAVNHWQSNYMNGINFYKKNGKKKKSCDCEELSRWANQLDQIPLN